MGITPIGRTIRVAHERAPSELHLMSLVRSPGGMVITAAMRVRWPSDGSCADLEITGAGPHLLPYDQLRAADDLGSHYRVVLSGEGGELTWQGAIGLPGALPLRARWLDLIADGTQRLVRIELNQADIQPADVAEPAPAVPPGERLLALAAERILASALGRRAERRPAAGPAVADLEDARFVVAGLATAAGQSFLHVVATGMAQHPIHGHDTGLSWWVRDGDGHWHLAMVSDPHSLQPSGAMGLRRHRSASADPAAAGAAGSHRVAATG